MTRERAHAYRRVIQTLNELDATTLGSREQDVIRHALPNANTATSIVARAIDAFLMGKTDLPR